MDSIKRPVLLCLACVLLTAFCSYAIGQDASPPPKRLLLIGQGPDDHPPSTHEYAAGMKLLAKCLVEIPNLEVKVVQADGTWPEGPELIREADAVVLFVSEGAKWLHADPRRLEAFAQLAARGGGMTALHWGMGTKDAKYVDGFVKLFGGCHGGPDRRYKHIKTTASVALAEHPVVAGIEAFPVEEEFYYKLKFVDAKQSLKPLLRARIDGMDETVCWAWERPDGGRSFGFTGLHYHRNWRLEAYRRLIAQGVLWSLKIDPSTAELSLQLPEDAYRLATPAP